MGSTVGAGDGVGSDVTVGAGAVVNVDGSTTSGSAVMVRVVSVGASTSTLTLSTLATGTFSPLMLADLVSNTLMFVPDRAEVPANLTPFTK